MPTEAEGAVTAAVEPVLAGAGADEVALRQAVQDTVGDLDAVADVLMSQSVHALLRGDAGVAAPTLAATGSGDSGLPAIDFPQTQRGGRQVTLRVLAIFGRDVRAGAWPGAATSPLALADPRLEAWAGRLLGSPHDIVVDFTTGTSLQRRALDTLELSALDVVYGVDRLGELLLQRAGIEGATIAAQRPPAVTDKTMGFDELVTLARSVRDALGRVRALSDTDFAQDMPIVKSWDVTDLAARLAAVRAVIPADDQRLKQLAAHEAEHPVATADLLIERLHILTVHPVPILPLLASGVPEDLRRSFSLRDGDRARNDAATWLAQAAKTRPAVRDAMLAIEMAELAHDESVFVCALAQTSDAAGRSWVGTGAPDDDESRVGWCNVTGAPPAGPVAGFAIDSWTETVPDRTMPTGIAVHFDRPSAVAPNAVLMVVTRIGQPFSLDYVARCVSDTLSLVQFRALGANQEHAFMGQYLPAVFLPGEAAVVLDESGGTVEGQPS